MFKVNFDKTTKVHFHKTDIVLPEGYIFKYRKEETVGIHYTGKNVIPESEFNNFTKMLILKQSVIYMNNELAQLKALNAEENCQAKVKYESLPEHIREACNKRFDEEKKTKYAQNLRKEVIAREELELCLANGGNPKLNYFDPVSGNYIRNGIIICEYFEHVEYERNTKNNIYNAVVIKELIRELTAH